MMFYRGIFAPDYQLQIEQLAGNRDVSVLPTACPPVKDIPPRAPRSKSSRKSRKSPYTRISVDAPSSACSTPEAILHEATVGQFHAATAQKITEPVSPENSCEELSLPYDSYAPTQMMPRPPFQYEEASGIVGCGLGVDMYGMGIYPGMQRAHVAPEVFPHATSAGSRDCSLYGNGVDPYILKHNTENLYRSYCNAYATPESADCLYGSGGPLQYGYPYHGYPDVLAREYSAHGPVVDMEHRSSVINKVNINGLSSTLPDGIPQHKPSDQTSNGEQREASSPEDSDYSESQNENLASENTHVSCTLPQNSVITSARYYNGYENTDDYERSFPSRNAASCCFASQKQTQSDHALANERLTNVPGQDDNENITDKSHDRSTAGYTSVIVDAHCYQVTNGYVH